MMTDPVGDTVRGTSEISARRTLNEITRTFRGRRLGALRRLFRMDDDGVSLRSISEEALERALSNPNITDDERSLARGYVQVINSTRVHYVTMVRVKGRIGELAQRLGGGFGFERGPDDWGRVAEYVEEHPKTMGGGLNVPTQTGGSYTFLLYDARNGAMLDDYVDGRTGAYVRKPSSTGERLAHELLGHGLGREVGSPTFRALDAIQLTNLYLRVIGEESYYRDGRSHGGGVHSEDDATAVPYYLQRSQ